MLDRSLASVPVIVRMPRWARTGTLPKTSLSKATGGLYSSLPQKGVCGSVSEAAGQRTELDAGLMLAPTTRRGDARCRTYRDIVRDPCC
jgi:hypothetical protein